MTVAHGPDFETVCRQPFARTAYQFLLLAERERGEEMLEQLRLTRFAMRIAAGFHDPSRLWSDERLLLAMLQTGAPQEMDRATLLAEARKLEARIRQGTPMPETVN